MVQSCQFAAGTPQIIGVICQAATCWTGDPTARKSYQMMQGSQKRTGE